MTDKLEIYSKPCKYMIYDEENYHRCSLIPARAQKDHNHMNFCTCALFYSESNPSFTIQFSVDPESGRVGSVSTFDFPGSEEYKDLIENTLTESDVPRLCPCGFTLQQIVAKTESLEKMLR